jgi:sialic acid synthase SpsE
LIAEVGSNFETRDHCLDSVAAAKAAGADAVKFQAFDWHELYGWQTGTSPHRMAAVKDWLHLLKAEADRVGIELMCTAFSPEGVALVDRYVGVHKIASSDSACPQMLLAAKATGKPVLISTGAKSVFEVSMAKDLVPYALFLSCTANYPADFTEVAAFDGLSDHTLGFTASVEAARQGAIVIEKHFTAFETLSTPDMPHSLTAAQFKRMAAIIRGTALDDGEEVAMFTLHNRRLIAVRDIAAGERFAFGDNFGAYRSLEVDRKGLSPFDWDLVAGKRAKAPLKRGEAIALEDLC